MLNPAIDINANVPTSETTIPTNGITVERISCKNTYTTKITNRIASNKVFTTSWMEANRKSLELITWVSSMPLGKSFRASSRNASICWFTSVAFDPAVWKIMQEIPGWPSIPPW